MISPRQTYLLRYWEKSCSATPTTPLRSAIAGGLLNCLSLDETVQLILAHSTIDHRLREKVLARLLDQVGIASLAARDSVLHELLDALADTPYPQKATVAYFLEFLYESMPPTRRRAIIRLFLLSPQRGMRKRAYKLLRRDWSTRWESDLQHCWEQWHESECALLIVDHFEAAFLIQQIDRLAEDLNNGAHVARLYLRACAIDSGLWTKLRKLDGITYAYVSARLFKNIPKRVARQLLRNYKHDARLGILAWSLGKLGHWDLLTELSANVEKLEEEMHRRDFERWGLKYPADNKLATSKAKELPPTPPPATESS